jgi:hypothetical protein
MNSAHHMFEATGDPYFLDRLERIAFNALPGAFFNGTMWALNSLTQVNKVDANDGVPGCENSNCNFCFGIVFECCTSNHGQGWPKLASRSFYVGRANGTLAVAQLFSACTVRPVALPGGTTVAQVRVNSSYPFDEQITIVVTGASASFKLEVRIPEWATQAQVTLNSGTPKQARNGTMHSLALPAGDSVISVSLPMKIRVATGKGYQVLPSPTPRVGTGAVNVFRGPLLYALPLQFTLDSKYPFDNNSTGRSGTSNGTFSTTLFPTGQDHGINHYLLSKNWRFALVLDDAKPDDSLRFVSGRGGSNLHSLPEGQGPFSRALVPVALSARVVALSPAEWPDGPTKWNSATWNTVKGTCSKGSTSVPQYNTSWVGIPPASPVNRSAPGASISVMLLPFGATDLRLGELPTVLPFSADATDMRKQFQQINDVAKEP